MANSKILDQLRADMPEDVKYVTVERCPNMMAVDVFFLVGEKWRVARKVDYETLHHRPGLFWDAVEGGGEVALADDTFSAIFSIDIGDTDDEPPKRWAAANDVAQSFLSYFKLGEEFCEHVGWLDPHIAREISLQEQEELSGKILEFIKPLLMKEADVPFPRRLPLPTVACSECGAGVEVRRQEDQNGFASVMIDGHIRQENGCFIVRCYKCPPKVGPIVCDGGPVEVEKPENLKLLPQNEDVWKAAQASHDVKQLAESTANSVARGKPITMDDCLEGAAVIAKIDADAAKPSGGCTCGAWVTPGARHDDHCDLAE